MRLFVFGASGYVGRHLVERARHLDRETIAHLRPDSTRADSRVDRFNSIAATIDRSPWQPQALLDALVGHRPDVVFSLIGTTAKSARAMEKTPTEAYRSIDLGLTMLLIEAAKATAFRGRFVYLSSIGAGSGNEGSYLAVRGEAEQRLIASGLEYTIARPSFISGPDRGERRRGERIASRALDAMLTLVAPLGGRRLAERYRSLSGSEVAAALLCAAEQGELAGQILETAELRRLAQNA